MRIAPTIKPPTPQQRDANIEALRWWWWDANEYYPHTPQLDVHMSDARFKMAIAGTRGGKSLLAGEEATLYLFAGATRVWIVGQTYALCEKEFRYVLQRMASQQALELFNGVSPIAHVTNNPKGGDMHIRTKWGSEVICISLERADIGAFGEEVDYIILSEGAQIKRPKDKWQRILRGRLASRLGKMILPTTPAGKTNKHDSEGWLFDMYQRGLDPADDDYYTRQWASWENPHFPEDPYELAEELDPKIFMEQYGGEFMVFSGAVFDLFDENIHVIQPFKIPKHWRRYEGIDPGFSGRFVWLSTVISERGNLYLVDEYSDSKMLYEDRVQAIKDQRAAQYGIHPTHWERFVEKNDVMTTTRVDSAAAQGIAELTNLGIPCSPADKFRDDISVSVDRVNRKFRFTASRAPNLYITSNCVETIEAMKFHSWGEKTYTDTTDIRKPANDKWKHWGDTLRYICASSLIPSEEKVVETELEGEDLYGIMMEMIGQRSQHPHDMSPYDRRMGV